MIVEFDLFSSISGNETSKQISWSPSTTLNHCRIKANLSKIEPCQASEIYTALEWTKFEEIGSVTLFVVVDAVYLFGRMVGRSID